MRANSKQPMNNSFFMIRFLSLLRLKFKLLDTTEETMIPPLSMSKQDLWIAHFFCLVNGQNGKKLQKIIGKGMCCGKTTLITVCALRKK
jgi:hypothetical protein